MSEKTEEILDRYVQIFHINICIEQAILVLQTCLIVFTKSKLILNAINCILPSRSLGQVAQSVEQRPEKPCVAGSIPALSTETIRN